MKNVIIALLLIFATSCATASYRSNGIITPDSDYIDILNFCKKNQFQYSFDTIDDLIKVYSPDREAKLLLNSLVATLDGSLFYLKKPPLYFKGKIFLPRQLAKVIISGEFVNFRPLFNIKKIVIDPGHGGKDPGAISPRGLKEKTVNLMISRYLKEELQKYGFDVVLTRTRDVFLSLAERTNIAKKNNADLFISIHANSNRSSKVDGVEIYYLRPSQLKSRERSVMLARSESFQERNIPTDVKAILWDMLISKNYGFSVELSDILYLTFKNLGFKAKPPIKSGFYVLRYAYVPSVLVETGYLSNRYDEIALRKKHYQKQIASAIALAVSSLKQRHATQRNIGYADSD